MPADALSAIESQVGAYRLLERIGEGGHGIVYRALDSRTQTVVALKTSKDRREGHFASIRRELDSLRQLRHSGIVRVLDGGVVDGRPWYAMELHEGDTLAERLSGEGPGSSPSSVEGGAVEASTQTLTRTVSSSSPASSPTDLRPGGAAPAIGTRRPQVLDPEHLRRLLTLFRQLCAPLAYLHGERFVHRDLKPSNIFIRTDGTPVIMDFGLVVLLQREAGRETVGVIPARGGTLGYVSPEQLRGERVDARADLFALGCIMYQAFTGRLPFVARDSAALADLHARSPPEPPQSLVHGLPLELDRLILRMLAFRPRERVGHASDVAAVLGRLGGDDWPRADDPAPRPYLYRPELAGREALVRSAETHLGRLNERRGGVLLLSGESGIGKSSALVEVARIAEMEGIRVVSGECVSLTAGESADVRRGGPLHPFRPLLVAVADRCMAQGEAATERLLGDRRAILLSCEPLLGAVPAAGGAERVPDLPTEAARRRLLEALAETVAAYAAEAPLLLIIDDLQWADDLSLAFLEFLPPAYFANNPVLIVAAFRSEEASPEIRRIAELGHVDVVRLDRLDARAVRSMTEDMLGDRNVPQTFVQMLSQEAAGSPFIISEYLRAAVEFGLLARDPSGRWLVARTTEAGGSLPLPSSLRDLVARRLGGLSKDAQLIVEAASVLGRESEQSAVAAIAAKVGEMDEEAFLRALDSLRTREILEDGAPGALRFSHDKLREIAHEQIEPGRRRLLHAHAGWHLAGATSGPDRSGVSARLAHHFEQAGEIEEAARYLQDAGEFASRRFANRETVSFFGRAALLEKTSGLEREVPVLARRERLLGEAFQGLGEPAIALRHLLEAARLLHSRLPSTGLGLVARCLWEVVRETARRVVPESEEPERSRPDFTRLIEASRVFHRLPSVCYYVTGDLNQVLCAALMNLSLAEAIGPSPELAMAMAGIHLTAGLVPLRWVAAYYGQQSRSMLAVLDDPSAATWVLFNTAAYAMGTCQWDVVLEQTAEIRRVAHQIGFHRRWEESTALMGTTLFIKGDIDGSERAFEDLSLSGERGDVQTRDWALVGLAHVRLLRGDAAGALRLLQDAKRLLEQGLGRAEQIYTRAPLALAHLYLGDPKTALEEARTCLGWIAEGAPIACYTVFAYASVAEVFLTLLAAEGATKERVAEARRAVRHLRTMAKVFPAALPAATYSEGALAAILGAPARARRWLERSQKLAVRFAIPYQEARTADLLATVGATPDEARALRARAAAIADQLRIEDAVAIQPGRAQRRRAEP